MVLDIPQLKINFANQLLHLNILYVYLSVYLKLKNPLQLFILSYSIYHFPLTFDVWSWSAPYCNEDVWQCMAFYFPIVAI